MKLRWGLTRPDPIQIETEAQARKLRDKIQNVDLLAIDTETTGLDISRDVVIFWSLSTGNDRYFLEAKHLPVFKKLLADPRKTWIGSQVKYDANILHNSGYRLGGELICTLTMDRLLNPDQEHGLKQTYERVFCERMASFAETFYPKNAAGKPRKPPKKSLQEIMMAAWEANPQAVIDYASLDAWSVFRLFEHHKQKLDNIQTWRGYSLWYLFMTYEMPFTRVLLDMERKGCQLDINYLKEMEPLLEQDMEDANKELNKLCGEVINPNSTPQLRKLLFDKMGLKPSLYTSGGQSGERKASVNVTVLTQFAEQGVKEAGLVLKYRELSKLLGTYVRGLVNRADSDGRIHTTFNQHVAETARLSSSEPNLQNQPRPRKNFDIRKAFIASPGKKLIVADYDQLEMFILAHFSKDKGLIGNIRAGRDIHTGNVELVWGEPYDDVARAKKDKSWQDERADYLRELRNYVKVIGFGMNYGKAANSIAREIGIIDRIAQENPDMPEKRVKWAAKDEAQSLIDRYFARIPGAFKFIQRTYYEAARTKFVETYLGRRRWLYEIMDWEDKERHLARAKAQHRDLCWCDKCRSSRDGERKSVNTIIQGTAADVMQCTMIRSHFDPRLRELSVNMQLQVHDEAMWEVPNDCVSDALPIIQENMENPGIKLRVPFKAGPHSGNNWVEAKD